MGSDDPRMCVILACCCGIDCCSEPDIPAGTRTRTKSKRFLQVDQVLQINNMYYLYCPPRLIHWNLLLLLAQRKENHTHL
jgi:hypothetical protein